jgi:hypothetical protein
MCVVCSKETQWPWVWRRVEGLQAASTRTGREHFQVLDREHKSHKAVSMWVLGGRGVMHHNRAGPWALRELRPWALSLPQRWLGREQGASMGPPTVGSK